MSSEAFQPLTESLAGHFEKPLSELPYELRVRVEQEFLPQPWDQLTAAQRVGVVGQLDYQNDPHFGPLREGAWEYWRKRDEWEATATPTALDKVAQKDELRAVEEKYSELEGRYRYRANECATEQRSGRTRVDGMCEEIANAIRDLGPECTSQQVMRRLKGFAGMPGSCIKASKDAGVTWTGEHGQELELNMDALRKRLRRRKQQGL